MAREPFRRGLPGTLDDLDPKLAVIVGREDERRENSRMVLRISFSDPRDGIGEHKCKCKERKDHCR